MEREEYIEKYSHHVIKAVKNTPLFASVLMAHALLESADRYGIPGNSTLTRKGKNHFGIKADPAWTGKTITLTTHEVIAGEHTPTSAAFRSYDNDSDSFNDRVKFLLKNKRYFRTGIFTMPTPEGQARALQKAGYAPDPKYADKLIYLMERYNLYCLDLSNHYQKLSDLAFFMMLTCVL